MPLPLLNEASIPNSIYFPSITFTTTKVGNDLVISANIILTAAKVTDAGTVDETWVATGQTQTVFIPDIMNLSEDLIALSSQIEVIYGDFMNLVDMINDIRKLL